MSENYLMQKIVARNILYTKYSQFCEDTQCTCIVKAIMGVFDLSIFYSFSLPSIHLSLSLSLFLSLSLPPTHPHSHPPSLPLSIPPCLLLVTLSVRCSQMLSLGALYLESIYRRIFQRTSLSLQPALSAPTHSLVSESKLSVYVLFV